MSAVTAFQWPPPISEWHTQRKTFYRQPCFQQRAQRALINSVRVLITITFTWKKPVYILIRKFYKTKHSVSGSLALVVVFARIHCPSKVQREQTYQVVACYFSGLFVSTLGVSPNRNEGSIRGRSQLAHVWQTVVNAAKQTNNKRPHKE